MKVSYIRSDSKLQKSNSVVLGLRRSLTSQCPNSTAVKS